MRVEERFKVGDEWLTLKQINARTGIPIPTLRGRIDNGDSEGRLLRPVGEREGFSRPTSEELDVMPYHELTSKQLAERIVRDRRYQFQRKRTDALKRAQAEHAAAFSKPFIDASLLTAAERRQIRERVYNSAQRTSWRLSGAT